MSHTGRQRFDEIKKNWEAGLNNKETKTCLVKAWKLWTAKNLKCRGYERGEEEAKEDNENNKDMDNKEGTGAPEMAMPEEEGYSGGYHDLMMEDFGGGLPNIGQRY